MESAMQDKKQLIILVFVFLLSGCAWTNKLLVSDGESGNYTTLPVEVSELAEMAQYCVKSYEKPGRSPDYPLSGGRSTRLRPNLSTRTTIACRR